ncbi:phosphomannomutase [Cognatishimia activa]|uniref:phosphomannomutase n=1 Tax=Cognatishimia activa TaxID=1715691 RepID=UPI00222FF427|nr:phosphomannomutase [Cognatishimia activa]UZD91041.1 phosphomannomutase [Cognatishimia activa]
MAPKFGTSGVRGLVTELTETLVADYVAAFIAECATSDTIYIGWDLRESSPEIAHTCIETAQSFGISVVNCGVLPTPALAYAAQKAKAGAIMVTGSHIPADRNGIKFYTVEGEITKADEARITEALGRPVQSDSPKGRNIDGALAANALFKTRYTSIFSNTLLAGLRIGVYQHSSVARDILMELLQDLGATAVALERTDSFVPVDTEAVDQSARAKFSGWCQQHSLDALVSTDGDADRPMLTDSQGNVVAGDVLGAITARYLGATELCTPVSSNTMISEMSEFAEIHLTQIGSPYVVASIEQALAARADVKVVGYEANGGFLLGFTYQSEFGSIEPLLTRDCILPILATLAAARQANTSVSDLIQTLPNRFTAADRIAGVKPEASKSFLNDLQKSADKRQEFFTADSEEIALDCTDGLRVSFANGDIVHLRPSGNAPEFRCYAESVNAERSRELVSLHLQRVASQLR